MRLALHYQILIALISGTVIGIIFNPGEISLEDTIEEIQTEKDSEIITKKVSVTKRRVHLSESGESIALTYTRKVDGKSTVNTFKAKSAEEFIQDYPQWKKLYEEHGGGISAQITTLSKYTGNLFLRLLRMVTIPLIVTSLLTGVTGLGDSARFGSMFFKTMLYYLVTSILAISVGLMMVNLIQPGVGAELPGGGEGVISHGNESLASIFAGLLDKMIPTNPVESLANGDFLSIISFTILFGIFVVRVGGQASLVLHNLFQAAFDVMMGLTMFIIRLAPIGVFAFMVYAMISQGLEIFMTLGWYMLTVFLALVFHSCVTMPLILKFVAKQSPLKYAKAMSPALMTAVSTASSNGTLPLTLTCVEERAGVSNRISSFVLPLGATINMDGTALYEAVAVLFIAQATPGFAMTFESQIIVAITALLASVGAAGIPHAGLVMMAIVLQAVGLPLEAQGVIIAVDRVLDMCRTSVNVWSDSCGCAVLARFEQAKNSVMPNPK
jgi:Na+/H+-dicarboxylate symporter